MLLFVHFPALPPVSFSPSVSLLKTSVPGTMVCVVIAAAATFLSEHYGGPQVLFGLLIGLAISSILPQTKENERFTLLAVVGVAVLSALSMIF